MSGTTTDSLIQFAETLSTQGRAANTVESYGYDLEHLGVIQRVVFDP